MARPPERAPQRLNRPADSQERCPLTLIRAFLTLVPRTSPTDVTTLLILTISTRATPKCPGESVTRPSNHRMESPSSEHSLPPVGCVLRPQLNSPQTHSSRQARRRVTGPQQEIHCDPYGRNQVHSPGPDALGMTRYHCWPGSPSIWVCIATAYRHPHRHGSASSPLSEGPGSRCHCLPVHKPPVPRLPATKPQRIRA